MKFQAATGHAIRILGCLGRHNGRIATATDMAQELGITYLYFMKISARLKQSGLVVSEQGCNGGYRLARPIDEITIYDAVYAVEGDFCIDKGMIQNEMKEDTSILHRFFITMQDEMIAQMKATTIAQLYKKKKEHARISVM
ncbi:MAG: Rrf2 family transcriptional regulator [Christensenella sp.]